MSEGTTQYYLGDKKIKYVAYGDKLIATNPFTYTPSSLDPDAEAFLNATGITDETITNAINNLVLDLKGASLWIKFNIIYPFVGGTDTTHKYNLMDPRDVDAAFRLDFNGTITHNSDGITGDGSTGYADTFLSPSNTGGGDDDIHFSSYFKGYSPRSATTDIGSWNGTSYSYLNVRNGINVQVTTLNADSAQNTTATTLTNGYHSVSRLSSTTFTSSINKSHATRTKTRIGGNGRSFFLLAANNNGTAANFSNRNIAFFTMGFGLTTSEIDDLVDINETFQTALGRFA